MNENRKIGEVCWSEMGLVPGDDIPIENGDRIPIKLPAKEVEKYHSYNGDMVGISRPSTIVYVRVGDGVGEVTIGERGSVYVNELE